MAAGRPEEARIPSAARRAAHLAGIAPQAAVVTLLVLSAPSARAAGTDDGCQVAVTELDGSALPPRERYLAEFISDTMATEIASSTQCRVITQADIVTMIDYEAQRAACGADSSSCLAEIGGALGVDVVVSGSVRVIGSLYTVNVQLIDIDRAAVVDRAEAAVRNDPTLLRRETRNLARQLFHLPPLDQDDVVEERSTLSKVAIYAGFCAAGLGVLAMAVAGLAAGASYAVSQTGSLDYQIKTTALTGVFVFGAVATVALLAIPAGLAMAGGGLLLE